MTASPADDQVRGASRPVASDSSHAFPGTINVTVGEFVGKRFLYPHRCSRTESVPADMAHRPIS